MTSMPYLTPIFSLEERKMTNENKEDAQDETPEERFRGIITGDPFIDLLLRRDVINADDLEQIKIYSEESSVDLKTALKELRIIKDNDLVIKATAEDSGYTFVKVSDLDIEKKALHLIEPEYARIYPLIPIEYDNGANELTVAVTINNIKSFQLGNDLRDVTKIPIIKRVVASKKDIEDAINGLYTNEHSLGQLSKNAEKDRIPAATSKRKAPPQKTQEIGEEDEVVKFVNMVLGEGIKLGASDIHFDPLEGKGYEIRFRIDGVLKHITFAPESKKANITSIIKIKANLDIAKTRETQGGRISQVLNNGKEVDFRLVTIPSVGGEKMVMRILDNGAAELPLAKLGFSPFNLNRLNSITRKPYGALLVCGPTGSGKSTTLYSALNSIKTPAINILTVEDPVEYELEGITQIPVTQNLSFDQALRAALRADPDIILVGEIRDSITASIAMKAAMTGHMVFTTLHTNDAASTLTRLGDMNVEPFITGSTVEGVVAQRLVRRLCEKCKIPYDMTSDLLESIHFPHDKWDSEDTYTFFEPVGCKSCSKTGYKGRMGIHEILTMSNNIKREIIAGADPIQLQATAVSEGMITMQNDGYLKAAQGHTTIQEVKRVTIT